MRVRTLTLNPDFELPEAQPDEVVTPTNIEVVDAKIEKKTLLAKMKSEVEDQARAIVESRFASDPVKLTGDIKVDEKLKKQREKVEKIAIQAEKARLLVERKALEVTGAATASSSGSSEKAAAKPKKKQIAGAFELTRDMFPEESWVNQR